MTTQTTARVKQAEIASGVGAGVLGLGLGVLLPPYVRLYAVPHPHRGRAAPRLGHVGKHRLERDVEPVRMWWNALLYWTCWGALIGRALHVIIVRR